MVILTRSLLLSSVSSPVLLGIAPPTVEDHVLPQSHSKFGARDVDIFISEIIMKVINGTEGRRRGFMTIKSGRVLVAAIDHVAKFVCLRSRLIEPTDIFAVDGLDAM